MSVMSDNKVLGYMAAASSKHLSLLAIEDAVVSQPTLHCIKQILRLN